MSPQRSQYKSDLAPATPITSQSCLSAGRSSAATGEGSGHLAPFRPGRHRGRAMIPAPGSAALCLSEGQVSVASLEWLSEAWSLPAGGQLRGSTSKAVSGRRLRSAPAAISPPRQSICLGLSTHKLLVVAVSTIGVDSQNDLLGKFDRLCSCMRRDSVSTHHTERTKFRPQEARVPQHRLATRAHPHNSPPEMVSQHASQIGATAPLRQRGDLIRQGMRLLVGLCGGGFAI